VVQYFIESGISMGLVRPIKVCLNETYNEVCVGKNLSAAFPNQKI